MALSSFYNDPCHSSRLMDQGFGMGITPEDVIIPTYNFYNSNYFRPWKIYMKNAIQDIGSAIGNEKDKFKISLDVQQFRPNEIVVKITKKEIIIEGKHEERADEHGFISRQFIRKYQFPDNYDSDTVTSNLTSDGVLIITALKKYLKDRDDKERVIPIKMCETCPKLETFQSKIKESSNDMMQKIDTAIKTMNAGERKIEQAKMQNSKNDNCLPSPNGSLKLSIQENCEKSKMESCEEILQMAAGKFDRSNIAAKSEMSGFSSMSSETTQSKEASYSSTMSYDMKSSSEKTAEYINEIIATELKQAAENV